jgi:hypothetical protein
MASENPDLLRRAREVWGGAPPGDRWFALVEQPDGTRVARLVEWWFVRSPRIVMGLNGPVLDGSKFYLWHPFEFEIEEADPEALLGSWNLPDGWRLGDRGWPYWVG